MNKLFVIFNRNIRTRILTTDIFIGLILVIFIVLFSYLYVTNEKTFYYWDYNYYHDTTLIKALEIYNLDTINFSTVIKEIKDIWKSSYNDYSDYFKIFVIPIVLIFGDSREVYICGISLLYLFPLILSISYLSTKLIPNETRKVFWITCFISLLMPSLWLPTLKGFPDSLAASFICLASAIYLRRNNLSSNKDKVIISFLLVVAILFRRHFSYDVLTFFIVIFVLSFVKFFESKKINYSLKLPVLYTDLKNLFVIGLISITVLCILAWPFVQRIIDDIYQLRYISWHRSVVENISYYLSVFGIITVLLSFIGLVISVFSKLLSRHAVKFILLFLIVNTILWITYVKQLGPQYTLHFTPWLILGLVTALFTGIRLFQGLANKIYIFIFSLFIFVNFILGLTNISFQKLFYYGEDNLNSLQINIFSMRNPPEERTDYDEIIHLIQYLRNITTPKDIIYIASSSDILNDDIIIQTNARIQKINYPTTIQKYWKRQGSILNIPYIPFADRIHPYPLELLIKSDYVIVADPIQYHLRPEEQEILIIVYDIFINNWKFSDDFIELKQRFHLSDGVDLKIFKRVNKTSINTIIDTLGKMTEFIKQAPGGQLLWMDINSDTSIIINRNKDQIYNIRGIKLTKNNLISKFIYINHPVGIIRLTGNIEILKGRCENTYIKLSTVDEHGLIINTSGEIDIAAYQNKLNLNTNVNKSEYLLLTISDKDINSSCLLNINNIEINN